MTQVLNIDTSPVGPSDRVNASDSEDILFIGEHPYKILIIRGRESMDKKPLIGVSILAVVLLVLGSLSNVVGYQSVKSTVNDSPLFQTRTQRATNQQQNSITSQYLGRGKHNLLQFPLRDNRTEQLRKAIDIISKMDEQTFTQFTQLCIKEIHRNPTFVNADDEGIKLVLLLFRKKSLPFNLYTPKDSNVMMTEYSPIPTICWIPHCFIFLIVYLSLMAVKLTIYNIGAIIYFILWLIQGVIDGILHVLTLYPCLYFTLAQHCSEFIS